MTDASDQSAAEMRSLLGFARGLGLDEATVREIYEAIRPVAAATRAGNSRTTGADQSRDSLACTFGANSLSCGETPMMGRELAPSTKLRLRISEVASKQRRHSAAASISALSTACSYNSRRVGFPAPILPVRRSMRARSRLSADRTQSLTTDSLAPVRTLHHASRRLIRQTGWRSRFCLHYSLLICRHPLGKLGCNRREFSTC